LVQENSQKVSDFFFNQKVLQQTFQNTLVDNSKIAFSTPKTLKAYYSWQ